MRLRWSEKEWEPGHWILSTFKADLELVVEFFKCIVVRLILRNDVSPVPGSTGELEEILTWIERRIYRFEDFGG